MAQPEPDTERHGASRSPSSAATASRSRGRTPSTPSASNQEMLTAALDGLVERYGLEGERAGEFVAGAVLKHSRDFNLARETVLGSAPVGRRPRPHDIQQACDTGIQATIQVANKIALGKIEFGIAGGADTTSDAPLAVGDKLRKILLEANARQGQQGSARRDRQDPPRAPRSRPAAQRRAAHRPVDGRQPGHHHQASGASPARPRTSSPWRRTRTSPRPTTRAGRTTSSRRSWASSATTTCVPTPRWRSWPSSSRSSARATTPR